MEQVRKDDHEVDGVTGTATTGHEWDGIRELNTPLPRWWLTIFYATIVWAFGYWVVYPAWPLIHGATSGIIGYATRLDVQTDLAALRAFRATQTQGLAEASLEQIRTDPALLRIAMAQGKAAFGDNCAGCHGVGGGGAKGYPNLNDDDWLWGGALAAIQTTLQHGIRVATETDTRQSQMPASAGTASSSATKSTRSPIMSAPLLGFPSSRRPISSRVARCSSRIAPPAMVRQAREIRTRRANLTDAISLYGMDVASLAETIGNGRGGAMPAWRSRLDATTIKALTVYVHSLGGGQ